MKHGDWFRPVLVSAVCLLWFADGLSPVGSAEKNEPPASSVEAPAKPPALSPPSDAKPKPADAPPPANGSKQPSPAAPEVKPKEAPKSEAGAETGTKAPPPPAGTTGVPPGPPVSPEAKPKPTDAPPPANGSKQPSPAAHEAKPKEGPKKETPAEPGAKAPATPSLPATIIGRDGASMVLVPAGEFTMGSEQGDEDERPVHRVYLDAFYLDKVEVTNARFAKFSASVMSEPPWGFANQEAPIKKGDQPVQWVNWMEATAYCAWVGKRLPTEAEWEKAARGTDGRTYPWGNDPPTPARAVFGLMDGAEPSPAVDAREDGKSPYGALDMAGNLYEWVADWYAEDFYRHSPARNPRGPSQGALKLQRGGSFTNNPYRIRSTFRTKGEPTEHHPRVGFRCAQDPPGPK